MAETEQSGELLKIVYMGTPAFAATILAAIMEWEGGDVVGVYTQPDRPAGRGLRARPSQVKQLAMARTLPVFQPASLKKDEAVEELRSLAPDVIIVAAYGLILPQSVLDIPRYGCINVHASLLPKYRGAAPIQRAIMNGDPVTGITIMQMDAGLDSGDMLLQRALGIDINDTAATLHDELADMGGRMMVETLDMLGTEQLAPIKQDAERATYASKLSKDEGLINWELPVQRIHNTVRAMHPWPGTYFFWSAGPDKPQMRLGLTPGLPGPELPEGAEPGDILGLEGDSLAIACGDNMYLVPKLRPESKKEMTAQAFANGYLSR